MATANDHNTALPNNYSDNINYSKSRSDAKDFYDHDRHNQSIPCRFPLFSMRKSVDFVKLTGVYGQYKDSLHEHLIANGFGFKPAGGGKLPGTKDKKRDKYSNGMVRIKVFYKEKLKPNPFEYDYALRLKIYDPDRVTLNILDAFFMRHALYPTVSVLELTHDLYTDDVIGLFEFLRAHTYQKCARNWFPNNYQTSFYTNDVRNSSKGCRCYLEKDTRKPRYVRLEFVLRRRGIKTFGIEWPLENLDSLDLSNTFKFMNLDIDALRNHLIWRSRYEIFVPENYFYWANLGVADVDFWVTGILMEAPSLMAKLQILRAKRGGRNYQRFLSPHEPFSKLFWAMAKKHKFIPYSHGESLLNEIAIAEAMP